MTSEDYIKLYEKYQFGKCSPEEVKLLLDHFSHFKMEEADPVYSAEEMRIKQVAYKRIENQAGIKRQILKIPIYWWSVAAVSLILSGALLIFWKPQPLNRLRGHPAIATARIEPAAAVATLKLADGSVIELEQAENGILSSQGMVNIRKEENGELVYESGDKYHKNAGPVQNTLTIPRGGHYQIVLNDGTKVWLNAESSLTFPAAFTDSERRVQLVGEAYFEVAENKKKPFKVLFGETQVEVLGTHFNIRAYADDELIKTTLLEGSIRLSTAQSEVLLKPGEQGYNRPKGAAIGVARVKTREAIAWKNGLFIFHDENLTEIMKQISRWYNVDVDFQTAVSNQKFGGVYSKNKELSELLRGLELTGLVKFEIKGRRVIVKN